MDYGVTLCVCYALAPFVAMTRELVMNRRPWFTFVLVVLGCSFALGVTLIFIYTRVSDSFCYSYRGVTRQLWQCSGTTHYYECCREVEAEVTAGCGWNYSRAEFCSVFGDMTLEYCSFNYCPVEELVRNITAALPSNNASSLALSS